LGELVDTVVTHFESEKLKSETASTVP